MNFNEILKNTNYDVVGIVDLERTVEHQLRELRQEVFDPNQRIFVSYVQDHFTDIHTIGAKLRELHRLLQHVDITNCFVTVITSYESIADDVIRLNADQPMEYIISTDKFKKDIGYKKTKTANNVYNSTDLAKIGMKELTERERFLLTESKTFCMYPWVHLHAYPTGDAQPCCHAEHMAGNFGNVKKQTLKEIWSSDKMKNLRKGMLNEQGHESCRRCYEQEAAGFFSGRQSANKHHGHHIKKSTDIDPSFEMTYWDIRFSNLCNLSCRSCGHIFSSSWYKDQKELYGAGHNNIDTAMFYAGRHEMDMFEQLMEHIDYVEQIYFAGGEPLTMKEHYMILDELEKREMFDVKIVYNTNFTKNKLKDKTIFDYWSKFKNVGVGASLDAMGPRAELIRNGTVWADVEYNRQQLLERCPHVDFYISPTMSIQNVLHIPDFHRNWVERGWLQPQDLNVNILQDPAWLRIDIATDHYKDMIREKIQKHLDWLRPLDHLNRATTGFESALRYLDTGNRQDQLPVFWEKMKNLDRVRNQSTLDIIPELHELTK